MRIFFLTLGFAATLLSACITPSPLALDDTVSVTGQIVQLDGQPAAEQALTLEGPLGFTSRQARTDANGNYLFELQGRDTQILGAAADLMLRVGEADAPQLTQRFKVLKTQLGLPAMRFWNGLELPLAGETLSQLDFRWESARPAPPAWELELQTETGTAIWRERVTSPSAKAPDGVLESARAYRWRVASHFSDYSAWTAPRSLNTGALPLQTLPVARISGPNGLLPALHDGDYASSVELRGGEAQTLQVQLRTPARSSGLYWKGSAFEAEVTVRATAGGPVLGRFSSDTMGVLRWPEQDLAGLVLELRSSTLELSAHVAEIRVLGPAS